MSFVAQMARYRTALIASNLFCGLLREVVGFAAKETNRAICTVEKSCIGGIEKWSLSCDKITWPRATQVISLSFAIAQRITESRRPRGRGGPIEN